MTWVFPIYSNFVSKSNFCKMFSKTAIKKLRWNCVSMSSSKLDICLPSVQTNVSYCFLLILLYNNDVRFGCTDILYKFTLVDVKTGSNAFSQSITVRQRCKFNSLCFSMSSINVWLWSIVPNTLRNPTLSLGWAESRIYSSFADKTLVKFIQITGSKLLGW